MASIKGLGRPTIFVASLVSSEDIILVEILGNHMKSPWMPGYSQDVAHFQNSQLKSARRMCVGRSCCSERIYNDCSMSGASD